MTKDASNQSSELLALTLHSEASSLSFGQRFEWTTRTHADTGLSSVLVVLDFL